MLPRLKIAASNRHIETETGETFFWLADTAWELFHRLSREECTFYFEKRAAQGFNVIQAVLLAELDGLRIPNCYGEIPLHAEDPQQPNEKYFQHVDWVLQEAARFNLYVALLPTWGDKVDLRYEWAKGPSVFSVENAKHYGLFLGERYRGQTNITWIIGGDRDPDESGVAIWRSLARGIIEGVGSKKNTLMTFHPQPFESGSSSRWFHNDEWLDFNMLQTGHDKQKNTFDYIKADYDKLVAKPVLDGEPTYEAHPLSFDVANGYSSEIEVRKFAYWSVFAGSCGHTYGCHSVWQFYTHERIGINAPLYAWKEALNLSGAWQMGFLKELMTSQDLTIRIPDQELIVNNYPKGPDYITATRASDRSYSLFYTPTGKPFQISPLCLLNGELRYQWFSPRDGTYTLETRKENDEELFFKPPYEGCGLDWVLVINAK